MNQADRDRFNRQDAEATRKNRKLYKKAIADRAKRVADRKETVKRYKGYYKKAKNFSIKKGIQGVKDAFNPFKKKKKVGVVKKKAKEKKYKSKGVYVKDPYTGKKVKLDL